MPMPSIAGCKFLSLYNTKGFMEQHNNNSTLYTFWSMDIQGCLCNLFMLSKQSLKHNSSLTWWVAWTINEMSGTFKLALTLRLLQKIQKMRFLKWKVYHPQRKYVFNKSSFNSSGRMGKFKENLFCPGAASDIKHGFMTYWICKIKGTY